MSYTIKHLFHIKSSINEVFDALTDIQKLQMAKHLRPH